MVIRSLQHRPARLVTDYYPPVAKKSAISSVSLPLYKRFQQVTLQVTLRVTLRMALQVALRVTETRARKRLRNTVTESETNFELNKNSNGFHHRSNQLSDGEKFEKLNKKNWTIWSGKPIGHLNGEWDGQTDCCILFILASRAGRAVKLTDLWPVHFGHQFLQREKPKNHKGTLPACMSMDSMP